MELLKENINNLISEDLDRRNQNWTTIENSLELKADKSTVYSKSETDQKIAADIVNYHDDTVVPSLYDKADKSNTYTKSEVDTLISESVGDIESLMEEIINGN